MTTIWLHGNFFTKISTVDKDNSTMEVKCTKCKTTVGNILNIGMFIIIGL